RITVFEPGQMAERFATPKPSQFGAGGRVSGGLEQLLFNRLVLPEGDIEIRPQWNPGRTEEVELLAHTLDHASRKGRFVVAEEHPSFAPQQFATQWRVSLRVHLEELINLARLSAHVHDRIHHAVFGGIEEEFERDLLVLAADELE